MLVGNTGGDGHSVNWGRGGVLDNIDPMTCITFGFQPTGTRTEVRSFLHIDGVWLEHFLDTSGRIVWYVNHTGGDAFTRSNTGFFVDGAHNFVACTLNGANQHHIYHALDGGRAVREVTYTSQPTPSGSRADDSGTDKQWGRDHTATRSFDAAWFFAMINAALTAGQLEKVRQSILREPRNVACEKAIVWCYAQHPQKVIDYSRFAHTPVVDSAIDYLGPEKHFPDIRGRKRRRRIKAAVAAAFPFELQRWDRRSNTLLRM